MPIELDMSIEETIEHLERIANNQFECADRIDELHCDSTSTRNMASYHKRLAEWLKELKKLRKFAHYVAYSITAEEEEFNENPRFFGESYCRKLHKLGIIKMVDNKWVYDEEVTVDEDSR